MVAQQDRPVGPVLPDHLGTQLTLDHALALDCSPIRICARVDRIRQYPIYVIVIWFFPYDLSARAVGRELHARAAHPKHHLSCAAQFEKFGKHQVDDLSDAGVGTLFDAPIVPLAVTDRHSREQFSASRFLAASFCAAQAQELELIFIQTSFESEQ
jgi:hypothetical protein